MSTPIIPGKDKATNFKFGRYIHRVHPNKSPLKFGEKMERGCIQGLPKFFVCPLLCQKRVKLRTSTFVRTFLLSNKSLLQISGKGAGCVVRTLKTFQGTHILGASRGLLCDSSAVLFVYPWVLANAVKRKFAMSHQNIGNSLQWLYTAMTFIFIFSKHYTGALVCLV